MDSLPLRPVPRWDPWLCSDDHPLSPQPHGNGQCQLVEFSSNPQEHPVNRPQEQVRFVHCRIKSNLNFLICSQMDPLKPSRVAIENTFFTLASQAMFLFNQQGRGQTHSCTESPRTALYTTFGNSKLQDYEWKFCHAWTYFSASTLELSKLQRPHAICAWLQWNWFANLSETIPIVIQRILPIYLFSLTNSICFGTTFLSTLSILAKQHVISKLLLIFRQIPQHNLSQTNERWHKQDEVSEIIRHAALDMTPNTLSTSRALNHRYGLFFAGNAQNVLCETWPLAHLL